MVDEIDTIAAIATPPGAGGVGVIRVSGPKAESIAHAMMGRKPEPQKAIFSKFKDAEGIEIDHGLALFFQAPTSYTGECVLELQGHGGAIVIQRLLKRVLELGARPAKPGEFTERAFLNGKIDLLQAEAVADLINSASEQAAKSAIRSLRGEFSRQIEGLKQEIVDLRKHVEAYLDFTEEELEIPVSAFANGLKKAIEINRSILGKAHQGAILNEGYRITLVGEPNVGKSSLLNRLLLEERAIVTDIPGTTRDTLTERFLIEGVPFVVTDTAGLRQTQDPVELEGINRTHKAIAQTDLVIVMSEYPDQGEITLETDQVLYVINKIDRAPDLRPGVVEKARQTLCYLSAKTGAGVEEFKQELLRIAQSGMGSEGVYTARQRHLVALQQTAAFLDQAQQVSVNTNQMDLFAENLRQAQESLSRITGEFTTEDLLDEIFSGFCIGK